MNCLLYLNIQWSQVWETEWLWGWIKKLPEYKVKKHEDMIIQTKSWQRWEMAEVIVQDVEIFVSFQCEHSRLWVGLWRQLYHYHYLSPTCLTTAYDMDILLINTYVIIMYISLYHDILLNSTNDWMNIQVLKCGEAPVVFKINFKYFHHSNISNDIHHKVWYETTNPLPNFKSCSWSMWMDY